MSGGRRCMQVDPNRGQLCVQCRGVRVNLRSGTTRTRLKLLSPHLVESERSVWGSELFHLESRVCESACARADAGAFCIWDYAMVRVASDTL
eukprot:scaffold111700_cov35-Tisochrysis_lutea.AAC.3